MPVTVAVDARGESVHTTGPALWRDKIAAAGGIANIGKIPVVVAS
jgi:hypothetical protein